MFRFFLGGPHPFRLSDSCFFCVVGWGDGAISYAQCCFSVLSVTVDGGISYAQSCMRNDAHSIVHGQRSSCHMHCTHAQRCSMGRHMHCTHAQRCSMLIFLSHTSELKAQALPSVRCPPLPSVRSPAMADVDPKIVALIKMAHTTGKNVSAVDAILDRLEESHLAYRMSLPPPVVGINPLNRDSYGVS